MSLNKSINIRSKERVIKIIWVYTRTYVCRVNVKVQIQFIIISKNSVRNKKRERETENICAYIRMYVCVLNFYLYKMMLMKTEL